MSSLPYRKKVDLPTGTDYWWVFLAGYGNAASCEFPFPTEQAARKFAEGHRRVWPDRQILVKQGVDNV